MTEDKAVELLQEQYPEAKPFAYSGNPNVLGWYAFRLYGPGGRVVDAMVTPEGEILTNEKEK